MRVDAYNRYMYAMGNPLRYSDPSGYLTEDEIRTLLGDDYDRLMSLWREYDPYWISVLEAVQPGGTLEASLLNGELHFEGSGTDIQTNIYGSDYSKALQHWQGQGVYSVRNPSMNEDQVSALRDALFGANESSGMPNTVIQPVFRYARTTAGEIDPIYQGARMLNASVDLQYHSAVIQALKAVGMSDGNSNGVGALIDVGISLGVTKIGTAAASYGTVGGALIADVVTSVVVSYNSPAVYSAGWPGGVDINPFIGLDRFSQ